MVSALFGLRPRAARSSHGRVADDSQRQDGNAESKEQRERAAYSSASFIRHRRCLRQLRAAWCCACVRTASAVAIAKRCVRR